MAIQCFDADHDLDELNVGLYLQVPASKHVLHTGDRRIEKLGKSLCTSTILMPALDSGDKIVTDIFYEGGRLGLRR